MDILMLTNLQQTSYSSASEIGRHFNLSNSLLSLQINVLARRGCCLLALVSSIFMYRRDTRDVFDVCPEKEPGTDVHTTLPL